MSKGISGFDRKFWEENEKAISRCRACLDNGRWHGKVRDTIRRGEVPHPPTKIKILFVGVAPTRMNKSHAGSHFYSKASDQLRIGLFRTLDNSPFKTQLIKANRVSLVKGTRAFTEEGLFFVHAAKVRPTLKDAPPRDLISFCAEKHLKVEIANLAPVAVCFLGRKNLKQVAKELFERNVDLHAVKCSFDGWSGYVSLAPQPKRGHSKETNLAVRELYSKAFLSPR